MTGYSLPTTNETNVSAKANQLANFPLNFLRTGIYYYTEGTVQYRTTGGTWRSATGSTTTNAYYLSTIPTFIYPQYNQARGYGFALRCVVRQCQTTIPSPGQNREFPTLRA